MKNHYLLLVLLVISFFQMEWLHIITVLTFFDEALAVWALYVILTNEISNKRFKLMLATIVVITVLGVYSNFHYAYQTSFFPILNDIGNCFKVFITYIGASVYFSRMTIRQFNRFICLAYKFVKIMIIIMFPLCIANLFANFGMRQDIRYGLPSFSFIFGGAGKLSMLFYLIMTIQTIHFSRLKRFQPWDFFVLISSLFVWVMTLRARAIMFVIMYSLLFRYVIFLKKRIKINFWTISICVGLFFLVCMDQVEVYMGGESTARYFFLINGFRIVRDCFPLGYGFGTYGTDVAAKYYSPLYNEFGMDLVYGLSPDNPKFSHDTYWPAIMGQFGFLGIIAFSFLIYLLFSDMLARTKGNIYTRLIAVFLCATQVIASLATAVFFHFISVTLLFFAAIIICHRNICVNSSNLERS